MNSGYILAFACAKHDTFCFDNAQLLFQGCAFIEFGKSSEADLAILKNGEDLLGR